MEPSSKRRRLAPKVTDPPTQIPVAPAHPQTQAQAPVQSFPQDQLPPQQFVPPEPVAPQPERHDFEAYARHLQDAAMHIYQQTLKSNHTSVSVLMLRWEEDHTVVEDINALEKVFKEQYNYHTDKWAIPTVPNPSIKLGVRIASFLDNARPDHLLIIYYAGHGYVGPDNQLYWACNTREDAAKLKWDGVRYLFEDAQSEMLLLLDSCAIPDAHMAGRHGAKQAIAAYTPDQMPLEVGHRSFTASLAESLHRLGTGRPFSAQRLFEDVVALRQQETAQALAKLANGTTKPSAPSERTPVFFTLTPTKAHGIILVPLEPKGDEAQLQSPPQSAETDPQGSREGGQEDRPLSSDEVIDLIFDEPRVLVCTTFVGEASPDMTSFHQWLQSRPPIASKITVEGMFLGPPTMLLISMPHSIWNVVQHDKVCCFLGHINSNNMIHLYKRLVNSASKDLAIPKADDTSTRDAIVTTPAAVRRHPLRQETPRREDGSQIQVAGPGSSGPAQESPNEGSAPKAQPKHEVEDSAEMKEAAEQLKALSHVRHVSDEATPSLDRQGTRIGDTIAVRHAGDPGSPAEANDSDAEDTVYSRISIKLATPPSAKPKARKPLQKQTPKQETRCTHCSHAPFKDSSSLRKHIAAAHTRPFPCAFAFAGCSSTFGSKNEWKRHIASQHLCLTYYRCSSCPQSSADGKGNEFNRKDLFTQHLRRMHAPFSIKKAINKGDGKLHADWESHVKEMQSSCLVIRRQPPQRSACPKSDCQSVFEGAGSWDEWTEHVGRHMEKGDAPRLGVDRMLAKWALEEGIIERQDDGEYRLTAGNGADGRDLNNSSFLSDSAKREDEDPSITVALPIMHSDTMDMD